MEPSLQTQRQTAEAAVLTKAAVRAADHLAITNKTLAAVLGISEASISRMRSGGFLLQPGQKAFELAILFVRLFRSLDAIVGGEVATARAWMSGDNSALAARPIEKIQTISGLMDVIAYLDARRAIV